MGTETRTRFDRGRWVIDWRTDDQCPWLTMSPRFNTEDQAEEYAERLKRPGTVRQLTAYAATKAARVARGGAS